MNRACRDNYKNQTPKGSLFTERKLWASERGVYAASPSLLLQLSLNSNLVGSFTLKRPDRRRAEAALWRAAKAEGRVPTNRQLLHALAKALHPNLSLKSAWFPPTIRPRVAPRLTYLSSGDSS